MQRAYLALLQRLRRAKVVPTKHVLDNECSTSMKNLIRDTCKLKLVPPYCHRRNVAEVQIKNFKSHFISILAGVAEDFPLYHWDKLIPQGELTFNLLRQSNTAPNVSAHAHLFGPFDYNRCPLAPMGCAVLIHVPTQVRRSWGKHTRRGWYVGCNLDGYRTNICVDCITKKECTTPTVVFKHHNITTPTVTDTDRWIKAAEDLASISRGMVTTRSDEDMRQLKLLADAVQPIVQRHASASVERPSNAPQVSLEPIAMAKPSVRQPITPTLPAPRVPQPATQVIPDPRVPVSEG